MKNTNTNTGTNVAIYASILFIIGTAILLVSCNPSLLK